MGLEHGHQGQEQEGRRQPGGVGEGHGADRTAGRRGQQQVAPARRQAERSDYQGRQESARPGHRQQVTAHVNVGVQHLGGKQGQQKPHRVEHGVGHEGQHHHVQDFPLPLPQVQDAVPEIRQRSEPPTGPHRDGIGVMQAHGYHEQHHRQVQRALKGKVPEEAQPENQQPTNKRPEYPGSGNGHHVDGVGVAHRLPRHRVGNQHLLQRLGDCEERPGNEHVDVGVPRTDVFAVHQEGEPQGKGRAHGLNRHHQLAPVQTVAQHTGEGIHEEAGQGVDCANRYHQQAADGGTLGQVLDQPADTEELQPGCGVGAEVGAPQQPEVPVLEERVQRLRARKSA